MVLAIRQYKTGVIPGADPGIFVKGGGGSNFPKILTSKKKTEEEWFKSIFQTIICIQSWFFFWGGGGGVRAWHVPLYKYTDDMVDLILYMYMCLAWGVWGSLHQKIFSLNGVKSCNSRQG